MTTALAPPPPPHRLPADAVPLREDGLLARVFRSCPEHEGSAPCVARRAEAGCLVFWCLEGGHHFVAHSEG